MTENKKMKVLLVDDDKFLLDMYSLKFKKSEIDIETSSSSSNALDKIRTGDFNVILLDIIMPGMDGMEILKKIREEKLVPGAKVIMLTNQAEEMAQAKALGVAGYIVKATTIPSEVVEKVISIYNNK
jgi:DNA-binding response OmpR family regulator